MLDNLSAVVFPNALILLRNHAGDLPVPVNPHGDGYPSRLPKQLLTMDGLFLPAPPLGMGSNAP